jgi:hypothetical protein
MTKYKYIKNNNRKINGGGSLLGNITSSAVKGAIKGEGTLSSKGIMDNLASSALKGSIQGQEIHDSKGFLGNLASSAINGKGTLNTKGIMSNLASSALQGVVNGKGAPNTKGIIGNLASSAINGKGAPNKGIMGNLVSSEIKGAINGKETSNSKSIMGNLASSEVQGILNNNKPPNKELLNRIVTSEHSNNIQNSVLKNLHGNLQKNNNGENTNINSLLSQKSQIINQKTAILNQKLSLLDKKSELLNQRLQLKKYNKTSAIKSDTLPTSPTKINLNLPPPNNHLGGIKNTEMPKDLIGKIKYFFKSDFFYFMKYYLYFIILFSICFYILMYIKQNSNSKMVIVESKIFFYICIVFLFIIINDILETPLESLKKFFLIIIFSLITVYIINYIVTKYYKKDDTFWGKLKIISLTTLSVYAITVLLIYFMFQYGNNKIGNDLFNAFSFAINKNFIFLVLLTLYLFWYRNVFTSLNWNASLTDILQPAALGGMLILFIFFFIIYLCLKFKIINRINVLNSFIVLLSISFFLLLLCINTFMSSLGNICTTGIQENTTDEQEMMCLLIIASIFIICWYDDVRNWHQIGSIIFIIVTLFTLYCMFYYSLKYPSTGLLSFWLFIEWLIIIFYRKQNSKNSLHFAFMKT